MRFFRWRSNVVAVISFDNIYSCTSLITFNVRIIYYFNWSYYQKNKFICNGYSISIHMFWSITQTVLIFVLKTDGHVYVLVCVCACIVWWLMWYSVDEYLCLNEQFQCVIKVCFLLPQIDCKWLHIIVLQFNNYFKWFQSQQWFNSDKVINCLFLFENSMTRPNKMNGKFFE